MIIKLIGDLWINDDNIVHSVTPSETIKQSLKKIQSKLGVPNVNEYRFYHEVKRGVASFADVNRLLDKAKTWSENEVTQNMSVYVTKKTEEELQGAIEAAIAKAAAMTAGLKAPEGAKFTGALAADTPIEVAGAANSSQAVVPAETSTTSAPPPPPLPPPPPPPGERAKKIEIPPPPPPPPRPNLPPPPVVDDDDLVMEFMPETPKGAPQPTPLPAPPVSKTPPVEPLPTTGEASSSRRGSKSDGLGFRRSSLLGDPPKEPPLLPPLPEPIPNTTPSLQQPEVVPSPADQMQNETVSDKPPSRAPSRRPSTVVVIDPPPPIQNETRRPSKPDLIIPPSTIPSFEETDILPPPPISEPSQVFTSVPQDETPMFPPPPPAPDQSIQEVNSLPSSSSVKNDPEVSYVHVPDPIQISTVISKFDPIVPPVSSSQVSFPPPPRPTVNEQQPQQLQPLSPPPREVSNQPILHPNDSYDPHQTGVQSFAPVPQHGVAAVSYPGPPTSIRGPSLTTETQTESRLDVYRRNKTITQQTTVDEAIQRAEAMEKLLARQERSVAQTIAMYYSSREDVNRIVTTRESVVTIARQSTLSPEKSPPPPPLLHQRYVTGPPPMLQTPTGGKQPSAFETLQKSREERDARLAQLSVTQASPHVFSTNTTSSLSKQYTPSRQPLPSSITKDPLSIQNVIKDARTNIDRRLFEY